MNAWLVCVRRPPSALKDRLKPHDQILKVASTSLSQPHLFQHTHSHTHNMDDYQLDYAELIGYVGGVVLAVSLVPQLVKSFRDRSTSDLSYTWQIVYIIGLWLNFAYFILVGAVAAWITLIFEILFAHLLFGLKMYLDGCKDCNKQTPDNDVEVGRKLESGDDATDKKKAIAARSRTSSLRHTGFRGSSLTRDLTVKDAYKTNLRTSVLSTDKVKDKFRGYHYTIDVRFTCSVPPEFGSKMLQEMLDAAKSNGIRSVGHMLELFDGSDSPPGFASAVLLDESHMSSHCYSDEGMLAFDCFTCGSNPEGTRRIAEDIAAFLKNNLANARIEMSQMPRFPINVAEIDGEECDCGHPH